MVTIPENYNDLLFVKKPLAVLATSMPDGSPQATPVWFDVKEGHLRFNTARGRVKEKNLKVDSRVALCIVDPENPYRYIQIRGRIANITEEGADAIIDSLAKKYLGLDSYPYRNPAEVRVTYEVEPLTVQAIGS